MRWSFAKRRTALRCSPKRAAAQLALRAQTVLADDPRFGCAARQRNKGTRRDKLQVVSLRESSFLLLPSGETAGMRG